jgi:hypothetical protein
VPEASRPHGEHPHIGSLAVVAPRRRYRAHIPEDAPSEQRDIFVRERRSWWMRAGRNKRSPRALLRGREEFPVGRSSLAREPSPHSEVRHDRHR